MRSKASPLGCSVETGSKSQVGPLPGPCLSYVHRNRSIWGSAELSSSPSSLSEEDDEKSDSEGGDLDKQMGDLNGEEADKLDERLWGDDDGEEDEEEEDSKTEETGPGMDEVIKRFPPSHSP